MHDDDYGFGHEFVEPAPEMPTGEDGAGAIFRRWDDNALDDEKTMSERIRGAALEAYAAGRAAERKACETMVRKLRGNTASANETLVFIADAIAARSKEGT